MKPLYNKGIGFIINGVFQTHSSIHKTYQPNTSNHFHTHSLCLNPPTKHTLRFHSNQAQSLYFETWFTSISFIFNTINIYF